MRAKTAASKSGINAQSGAKIESQVHNVGLIVIGVSACAIGLFAAASLIGGMIASGGPLALVGDWFKAVFGM